MSRDDTPSLVELEAAILQDPDTVDAYLVYADALQRRGDPRGELIARQHAALGATLRSEAWRFQGEADALIWEHEEVLLGALADAVESEELQLEWHLGFIRSARVAQADPDSTLDVPATVEALLAHPSGRFLRDLTVGMVSFGDLNQYFAVIQAVERAGGSQTLRSVFLGDYAYPSEWPISFTQVGDVSPLYAVLPRLRTLRLRGGGVELGDLDLPELRELTVETGGLPLAAVRSVMSARLPNLERLELWFGSPRYGGEAGLEDLRPLLDGEVLPGLRKLGLRNADFMAALCRELPRTKLLPRLQELDLSLGNMADEDAQVLANHAGAFRHLERLDLRENMLTDEGAQRLADLCADVRYQPQRGFDENDGDRYVAVGE
ncbi:TIGR02996 domain-containing protein [Pyxidicoccus sp. 3LFB2]